MAAQAGAVHVTMGRGPICTKHEALCLSSSQSGNNANKVLTVDDAKLQEVSRMGEFSGGSNVRKPLFLVLSACLPPLTCAACLCETIPFCLCSMQLVKLFGCLAWHCECACAHVQLHVKESCEGPL